MKSKLTLFALILSLLLATIAIPAASAASTVDIKLKIGSKQMTVNGKASTIAAPYLSGKTPMVPLTVAIKGLGAKLALKDNKVITLTYLKATVVLTKGSKNATFTGKKVVLSVAPADKAGVTMVPTKVLEGLGANVVYTASTKDIRITAAAAPVGSGTGGPAIDPDAGKSKIGDSYYGWSMNYPTGLAQNSQSSNGDFISFQDVKGDYYLGIFVEEQEEPLDAEEQRDLISGYADGDETVVDVKTVKNGNGSYERIVMKTDYGFFYEYRGFQANGYYYILIYGKKAKSASELTAKGSLLDSFRTSYDKTNKALKDLTKVKNGKILFEDADYGLKLQLPVDWRNSSADSYPSYRGPDNSYLFVKANSVKEGETLDGWVQRRMQQFKDSFAAAYMKQPELSSITWNGVPATVAKLMYSNDTKTWWEEYEIYAYKGAYKYYVELAYPQSLKDKLSSLPGIVQNELKVDFAQVEKSFGDIPDPTDIADLSVKTTKASKSFGYSITVPKAWSSGTTDMEQDQVTFTGQGINVYIGVDGNTSIEGYPAQLEKAYENLGVLKLDSKTETTLAGIHAIKYQYSSTSAADSPAMVTIYLLENKGNVYFIQSMIQNANASDVLLKALDESLQSFTFTSKS